jgi:DNA-binding transcriptional ArsR family regulator
MMIDENALVFAKAIADDTRMEIMKHCCCVWLSVTDIVSRLEGKVNQPTVSHHLKRLEEADLVQVRQVGRQRFYTLNQARVNVCCSDLMREFAPYYNTRDEASNAPTEAAPIIAITDIK